MSNQFISALHAQNNLTH